MTPSSGFLYFDEATASAPGPDQAQVFGRANGA